MISSIPSKPEHSPARRKPPAFVMVGLPGSGKSTWAMGHPAKFPIASTDAFIEDFAREKKITYAKAFKKFYKTATKKMKAQIDGFIKNQQPFVWDQTNLTLKERNSIYTLLSPTHEVHFVCMLVPLEICILQHKMRKSREGGNVVDEKRIVTLAKTATFPIKGDKADKIVRIMHPQWPKQATA